MTKAQPRPTPPSAIFDQDDSPIALCIRQRLRKGNQSAAITKLVAQLEKTQGADGLWQHSAARTIENMFVLSLLGKANRATAKTLSGLLEVDRPPMVHPCYGNLFFDIRGSDVLGVKDVPFTKGCTGFIKTGAALYFASVFEQGDQERVRKAFATLAQLPAKRGGRWCSASCSNNILQAFAVHPKMRKTEAMQLALKRLEKDQLENGAWSGGVPFYPTVFALSHIESKRADAMFRRALPRLQRLQKKDGSWGNKIGATFMVLDALQRKAVNLG